MPGSAEPATKFETHLDFCTVCQCRLAPRAETVEATLHDVTGATNVKVKVWRCVAKGCRSHYGPNFTWCGGKKLNTATVSSLWFNQGSVASCFGYIVCFGENHQI